MKTEAAHHPSPLAHGASGGHDPKTQRWLADLERALLDASPHAAAAPDRREVLAPRNEAAAATRMLTPREAEPVARQHATPAQTSQPLGGARAGAASPTVDSNAEIAREPESPPLRLDALPGGATVVAQSVTVVACDAPLGATSQTPAAIAVRDAQHADTALHAIARPAPRSLASPHMAAASPDDGTVDEAAMSADSPLDNRAPEYAKRVLQVAGDEELQLNLRDAALAQEQQASVAFALFEQMHHAGMPLRRVYINGQRFEHGAPAAKPSSPIQIHPTTKE